MVCPIRVPRAWKQVLVGTIRHLASERAWHNAPVTYVLANCPVHGDVHAKHVVSESSGPSGERFDGYLCPGQPDDPVCLKPVSPIGVAVERPDWAEYADEH